MSQNSPDDDSTRTDSDWGGEPISEDESDFIMASIIENIISNQRLNLDEDFEYLDSEDPRGLHIFTAQEQEEFDEKMSKIIPEKFKPGMDIGYYGSPKRGKTHDHQYSSRTNETDKTAGYEPPNQRAQSSSFARQNNSGRDFSNGFVFKDIGRVLEMRD